MHVLTGYQIHVRKHGNQAHLKKVIRRKVTQARATPVTALQLLIYRLCFLMQSRYSNLLAAGTSIGRRFEGVNIVIPAPHVDDPVGDSRRGVYSTFSRIVVARARGKSRYRHGAQDGNKNYGCDE